MTAPQHPAPTAESGCVCADPEVDRLRRLIRNGSDQWTASVAVFGAGYGACLALVVVLVGGAR